jgi:hypothetical protein
VTMRSDPPRRSRKASLGILIGVPLIVVVIFTLSFVLPGPLQHSFCPGDTVISGHLEDYWQITIAATLFVSLLAILTSIPGVTGPNRRRNALKMLLTGVAILIFGLGGWYANLFNYYCATPTYLSVNRVFAKRLSYQWRDVQTVTASCHFNGRGGPSIDLEVELNDGTWIDLGGDSLPSLIRNYHQISRLVRNAPYDNSSTGECPAEWFHLFATRPS